MLHGGFFYESTNVKKSVYTLWYFFEAKSNSVTALFFHISLSNKWPKIDVLNRYTLGYFLCPKSPIFRFQVSKKGQKNRVKWNIWNIFQSKNRGKTEMKISFFFTLVILVFFNFIWTLFYVIIILKNSWNILWWKWNQKKVRLAKKTFFTKTKVFYESMNCIFIYAF